jgi:two-component system chemotaxis sensor kinase CheA
MKEPNAALPAHFQTFLPSFLESSRELTDSIQHGLLRLEEHGPENPVPLKEVNRALHSLKGGAMTLGLGDISTLCHSMEDLLERFDPEEEGAGEAVFNVLLDACDALRAVMAGLESSPEDPVDVTGITQRITGMLDPDAQAVIRPEDTKPISRDDLPSARNTTHESIRVSTRKMDQFLNLAVELVIARNQMLSLLEPLANYEISQRREKKTLARIARCLEEDSQGPVNGENELRTLLNELMNERARGEEMAEEFNEPFRESLDIVGPLVKDMQQLVMETRMLPVSILFQPFPRSVRDFAKTLNKKVELTLEGEDTRIDKRAIEELGDPLTHLLRNAIDHGIEPVEERKRAGKKETGTIRLQAFHDKDKVVLEVSDDGRGIDREAVKKKALDRGFLTREQAAGMREHEVYDLLFLPGFSTAEMITELSGRGVGMDVVKRNVEGLNGALEITDRCRLSHSTDSL